MPNLRDKRLKVNGIGSPALGRGVYSTNVYTERLRPEVQPLTLLYIFFFLRKSYLFCIPCWKLCIPLNFCKCRVFKIRINHKNKTLSQLFKTINLSVSLFGPFYRPKWQISPPLLYTSTSKIPTISCTWRQKKVPLWGGGSPYRP